MKKIIAFVLFLFSLSCFTQVKKDSIYSKKLENYRDLTVSLPKSYTYYSKKTYPVLIVLDGDYLFDPINGAMSYGAYWDDLPEMIIVGIKQEKTREEDCAFDPETGLPDNFSAAFFEFIGAELLPYIQKKYPTSPFKMIAGHDVTANFLNYFLFKDEPIFNAYISFSSELAPNMDVNLATQFGKLTKPILYYHCSADGDPKKIKEDVKNLHDNLVNIQNPNIKYIYEEIKNTSHYSVVTQAIPSVLQHFFSAYQPISNTEFNEKIVTLNEGYVEYLLAKYSKIDQIMGSKTTIRYSDFKAIEAAILKNKAYAELEKLAPISKKMYPRAMLSDYQMALFYENTGDYKKAIKHYQSAFNQEEIGSLTKDMMLKKTEQLQKM